MSAYEYGNEEPIKSPEFEKQLKELCELIKAKYEMERP